MSFLTLNSWPITIKDGGAKRARELIGQLERSQGGTLRSAQRFDKLRDSFTTVTLQQVVAESLENLLRRKDQHHFSWDADLYSGHNGVGPEPGYAVTIGSTGTTKFGNKVIASVTTNTVVLAYDLGLLNEYTLLWWHQSGTSGTWNHYVKRSTGNNWINGVQSNPTISNVLVTSGVVQLKGITPGGATGTTQCYDDLVVLPYYLCDAAIPYFAARTSAFSDLPRLYLAGDVERLTSPTQVEVMGEFEGSQVIQRRGTSAWENNGSEVTFTLRGV